MQLGSLLEHWHQTRPEGTNVVQARKDAQKLRLVLTFSFATSNSSFLIGVLLDAGGALRMGPNEVHVYDPRFYHELYRLGSRYYKDPSMHKVLGAPSSTLAESDPVRHKQRKAPLEPLFAKKNILKLEPMLMEHVEYCSARFDQYWTAGKPVSLEWALKSLAMGTQWTVIDRSWLAHRNS